MSQITSQLPTTLNPEIGGRYVYDENFWKRYRSVWILSCHLSFPTALTLFTHHLILCFKCVRCCVDKYGWHNCILSEHGMMWKQLYIEKLIQERLEDFDSQTVRAFVSIISINFLNLTFLINVIIISPPLPRKISTFYLIYGTHAWTIFSQSHLDSVPAT